MIEIILAFLLIIVTSLFLYYLACLHKDGHWQRLGIPGPKGSTIFGNFLALTNREYPAMLVLRDWTKKFGKVYGIREGWRHVLVVSDAQMIQEMMIKKFEYFHGRKQTPLVGNIDTQPFAHVFMVRGARWKRMRTISSPSFSAASLKRIMPTVDDSVQVMMEHLRKVADIDKGFNIHTYFQELTMDIICRIALGQQGSLQFKNPYAEPAKEAFAQAGTTFIHKWANLTPFMAWLNRKVFVDILGGIRKDPMKELIDKTYEEVYKRKKMRAEGQVVHDGDRIDFIDLFLDAETNDINDNKFDHKAGSKVEKKLTTDEVAAQCFVFLLAGFDTTANTLANTCFYLAKNREKMEILQGEIDEICPDEEITYDQLQKLKYTDAVMKEALRLVPIAAFANSRECMETTTLGDMKIEKGTFIQADMFTIHHDKEIWGDDAEEFVPERWLENDPNHFAWMPFGNGPRTCIGMRLAYLEEKLALVRILREFDIVECPESEKELKLVGLSVLQPESVTVKLVKRSY